MEILNIVRQRWRLGLIIGLVLASINAYTKLNQPPKYKSRATMVVEINPEKMIQLQDVVKGGESFRIYDSIIHGYLERLRSYTMASFVLENLSEGELRRLKQTFPDAGTYETEDGKIIPNLAGLFQRSMRSSWRGDVQIVTMSAVHNDPHVAQIIVNGYCNSFILLQSNRLEERTGQVLNFLEEQSKDLESKLEEGEEHLQRYRTENNLVSVEGNADIVSQRLAQINGSLTDRKIELITSSNRLEQIEATAGDLELLKLIPFIAEEERVSDVLNQISQTKTERAVLAGTYGRKHPIMLENQAEIDTLQDNLKSAILLVINEVEKEDKVIKSEYASLQEELKLVEAEALELDRLAIEYRVLQRKLDVQSKIFDVVAEQFTATDISSQFDMASIRILDTANLPNKSFEPNVKNAITLSAVLFLGCFLGVPICLELFDNRLKTFADIETFIGKPVFGDILKIEDEDKQNIAQAVLNHDEVLAESFRSIHSSLKLSEDLKPPTTIMVTSTLPSEGKTFVACNLAETFSKAHLKTVLVDCDLRRPSVHRQFSLKNHHGVLEWIRSENHFQPGEPLTSNTDLGIQKITEEFYILPSGGSTKDPIEDISSLRFDQLISKLKGEFDVVIIDTPPSGLFPDAAMIAEFEGHTLFVAKQNEVPRQKVRFAVNRLERTNAPVKGVILNYIQGNTVAGGLGYYGKNYSYAYAYDRSDKAYKDYYKEGS